MSTHRCLPLRRSRDWPWKRAVTMSMRRSGAAVIRHSFSRPWVGRAACSHSTGIRRPSRPAGSVLPTKCGLRSCTRRLPSSARSCRYTQTVVLAAACSSTSACPRRSSMIRAAASVSAPMARSTCAWIRHAASRSAAWLARAGLDEIREVIATFGEERFARRVARAIVEARREGALTHTAELAALVAQRGTHARAGQASGDAHLPGVAHVHQ